MIIIKAEREDEVLQLIAHGPRFVRRDDFAVETDTENTRLSFDFSSDQDSVQDLLRDHGIPCEVNFR